MTATEDTYVQGLADEIARKVAALLLERDDRPLLTMTQAAERLGWSTRVLYERMEAGEIAWVQVGQVGVKGSRRVEPAELDRFIAERRRTVE